MKGKNVTKYILIRLDQNGFGERKKNINTKPYIVKLYWLFYSFSFASFQHLSSTYKFILFYFSLQSSSGYSWLLSKIYQVWFVPIKSFTLLLYRCFEWSIAVSIFCFNFRILWVDFFHISEYCLGQIFWVFFDINLYGCLCWFYWC